MGFRRGGFSPPLSLLMSAFALPIPPADFSIHLHRLTERSSTAYRSRGTDTPQASVHRLAPLNLPRRPTRPVSYYAFFKGWLLLSQPPGCLCLPTSFTTEQLFWDLSCGSGLFPFSRRTFAPAVCLPGSDVWVFGVCHGLVRRDVPLAITVLYPPQSYMRRYLNSFRGEPAISGFD